MEGNTSPLLRQGTESQLNSTVLSNWLPAMPHYLKNLWQASYKGQCRQIVTICHSSHQTENPDLSKHWVLSPLFPKCWGGGDTTMSLFLSPPQDHQTLPSDPALLCLRLRKVLPFKLNLDPWHWGWQNPFIIYPLDRAIGAKEPNTSFPYSLPPYS